MCEFREVPNVFGVDQDKYLSGIKTIFQSCLTHETVSVRSAAVKAYSAFICHNDDDDKALKQLGVLIPHVLRVS